MKYATKAYEYARGKTSAAAAANLSRPVYLDALEKTSPAHLDGLNNSGGSLSDERGIQDFKDPCSENSEDDLEYP